MAYRKLVQPNTIHQPEPMQSQGGNLLESIQKVLPVAQGAVDTYSSSLRKTIAADKIKQQARVSRGQLPSEDSTRAGYTAAAELKVALVHRQRFERLKAVAKQDWSDDEWSQHLVDSSSEVMESINTAFPNLDDEGKAALLAQSEQEDIKGIDELTKVREVARLKREEESRIEDIKGLMSTMSGADFKSIQQVMDSLPNALKLGEDKVISATVEAAINSNDLDLMTKVSQAIDSRGRRLSEVHPNLRMAIEREEVEQYKVNAGRIAQQHLEIEQGLFEGTMTQEQAVKMIEEENLTNNGSFMSVEASRSMFSRVERKLEQERKERERLANVMSGATPLKKLRPADREAVMNKTVNEIYMRLLKQEMHRSSVTSPEDLSAASLGAVYSSSVKEASSHFAKSGLVYEPWKDGFKMVATLDPETAIYRDVDGNAKISPETKMKLDTFMAIPKSQVEMYVSGKDARMLNSFSNLIQHGVPEDIALLQSMTLAKSPPPPMTEETLKSVKRLYRSHFGNFFSHRIPEGQEDYVADYVGTLKYNGMSDEDVQQALKENTFQLNNGQVITANLSAVTEAMGVYDLTQVENALEQFKENMGDVARRRMENLGMEEDDIYYDVNTYTGMVTLRGKGGLPITGASYSLEEIGDRYTPNSKKVKRNALFTPVHSQILSAKL